MTNGIKSCDVTLQDTSFSTCQAITGDPFFTGVGLAKNVPRDSLDDFVIELYCLAEGQLVIDPSQDPTGTLEGNLELDRVGILRRPGRGVTYLKNSPDDTAEAFSVYKDITTVFFGTDLEDGSFQCEFIEMCISSFVCFHDCFMI